MAGAGQWWQAARANNQIHLGLEECSPRASADTDFPKIKQLYKKQSTGLGKVATQDLMRFATSWTLP